MPIQNNSRPKGSLDKLKLNLGFTSGVDTKTDPKLAKGFLELENAYLENQTCKKSYGYESIVGNDNSAVDLYPKGVYSDNEKLITVFSNEISAYDSESRELLPRSTFAYLARENHPVFTSNDIYGFKGQGHVADPVQGCCPPYVLDSSYGDNAINIQQVITFDNTTKIPSQIDYAVRVSNTLDNVITRTFEIPGLAYTATVMPKPLDVLGTIFGFFIYVGRAGASPGTMAVDEYYVPYEPSAGIVFSSNVITDLVYADFTQGYAWHSLIRDLKAQSDGNYLYLGYRTGTQAACLPNVRVRSFNGVNVGDIPAATLGFTVPYSVIPSVAGWITGDQTRLTIASFVYVPIDPLETINVNGSLYSGIIVFMFSNRFVVIDLTRQVRLSVQHPVPIGAFPGLKNSCCDICYLKSTQELLFLFHSANELYQNTNVAIQFSPENTETLPVINRYHLPDNPLIAWTNTDTETIGTAFTNLNKSQYGSVYLASGFYYTPNNAYFAMAEMPYIGFDDNNYLRTIPISNSSTTGTISTLVDSEFTPVNERKCNAYIVDIDYNVVEEPILYTASVFNYVSVSLSGSPATVHNTTYSVFSMVHSRQNLVNNSMFIVLPSESNSTLTSGEVVYGNKYIRYEVFENPQAYFHGVQYGSTSYVGVRTLKLVNEEKIEEVNWYNYPSIALFKQGTHTQALSLAFACTFEYTLSTGEVVRSAPSIFKRVSMTNIITSTNTLDIFVTAPPMLTKRRNFSVKIWRTINNGEQFYLYYTMYFFPKDTTNNYFGRVRMGPETIPLKGADPITQEEFAYFNGGVIGDFPFETFTSFMLNKNRVFGILANDTNVIQYSNQYVKGSALSSAPLNLITVEATGGGCVGLGALDNITIVFKRANIYAITGTGPNNNGINGSFSIPEVVNSPVGCINAASIVRIPDGIMFQSDKGIYLLDRSLVVSYIGDKVERFNGLTICSASLLPTENKVVFSTYEGTTVIYDFYYKNWSYDSPIVAFGSTVYKNSLLLIDADNELFLQNKYIYTRDGSLYSTKITTPWFYTAGIQGLQRVFSLLFLGKFIGVHKMRVSVAYDFVDTVQDYQYFEKSTDNSFGSGIWGNLVPSDPYGGSELSTYQFEFSIPQQRCSAVRFTFEDFFDNVPIETGGSFELSDLTLVYGVEAVDPKLPVSRKG